MNETLRGLADAFYSLYDYKLNVTTFLLHSENLNCQEINALIETLRDFDGVILGSINSPEGIAVLREFAETMPALVILHADPPIPYLFASVHDPTYSAQMAAEFLACCLHRSAHRRVALFTGQKDVSVHALAARTFTQSAQELGLEVISVQDMQEDPELLRRQAEQLLNSPTPPDGIYITSGNSLVLCELVQKADPQPMLVTFDTYPELNAYLLNGTVKGHDLSELLQPGF